MLVYSGMSALLFLLLLCVCTTSDAYTNLPPNLLIIQPLQYINVEAIVGYSFDSIRSSIDRLSLPYDSNDALAVFISEGCAGFLGGVAQRTIARIDGKLFEGKREL